MTGTLPNAGPALTAFVDALAKTLPLDSADTTVDILEVSDRAHADLDAAEQARRDREDEFAAAAERLSDIGHGPEEIDLMLARLPS